MITFTKPKNFAVPEGIKEGDCFKVLCTVCAEGNDRMSLREIDGIALGKEDKQEKAEPKNMGERLDAGVDSMTGGAKGAIPRPLAGGGGGY